MSIPQLEVFFLNDVEDGGNSNDKDDAVPKIPCKRITGNLQIAVIQDLV